MQQDAVTLFRPTGEVSWNSLRESGWRVFPPRLPDQPFFYPVLHEAYATQIARSWNTRDGGTGYVLRFHVDAGFLQRYEVQTVGSSAHREYWIPAEDLDELNRHLIGRIELMAVYRSPSSAR